MKRRIRKHAIYVLICSLIISSAGATGVFADETDPVESVQSVDPEQAADPAETAEPDSGEADPKEPGAEETGSEGTELKEPGAEETGSEGTELKELGAENSGSEGTELKETGSEGTASEKTGSEENGDVPSGDGEDPSETGEDPETGSEGQTSGSEDEGSTGSESATSGTEGSSGEDASSGEDGKTGAEDGESEAEIDPNAITAIEDYDKDRLDMEFKPALDSLLRELPESIVIMRGEESEKISVEWKCEDDYDEYLGEYHFVPVLDDYILAPDLVIPAITVVIENEDTGVTGGVIDVDLSYDVPVVGAGGGRRLAKSSGLPSSYNAYYDGTLPQNMPLVRRQSPYGTCWAFSTIGAMETDLIHDGSISAESADLSELHLTYYLYHNYNDPRGSRTDSVADYSGYSTGYLDNGGNAWPAFRVLSNLVGAVQESDVPYSQAGSYSASDEDVVSKDFAQIRNAYVINSCDRDGIKSAIYDHGSVSAMYYSDGNAYLSSNNSYCTTVGNRVNHAVMLVGWDDSFSRTKFKNQPAGDGAYLVRNSWGQNGYGYNGYFWMSYYEPSFLYSEEVIAFDASTSVYNNCYAYDGQPLADVNYGIASQTVVTQEYNVRGGETVKAVGFEIGTANVTAQITVKNLKTNEESSGTVTTSYAGFYTAQVSPELDVPTDAEISVSIKYVASNNGGIDVICETPGTLLPFGDIVYTGVVDKGCKINGQDVSYDARMKLYTDNSNVAVSENIKLAETEFSGHVGETAQIEFTDDSTVKNASMITWSSSNTRSATVDENGVITFGSYKGSARITGSYTNGDGGAVEIVYCNATVDPYNVVYHITADTYTAGLTDRYNPSTGTVNGVFYPGDPNNDDLFNAMRTSGYYTTGWYSDSSLSASSLVDWHPSVRSDLELWPKWQELNLTVRYYAPYSDFSGYSPYTTAIIRANIPAGSLPYALPGAGGCVYNPNEWTEYWNNSSKYSTTKSFSYWSTDPEGRNKVTSVTSDAFNMHYSGGQYTVSLDTYLYPQYNDTSRYTPVTGVSLNKSSMTLDKGSGFQLTAAVAPANATNKGLTWSSSNNNVATVTANGYVKAVERGTAVITVRTNDKGKTATCKITVIREVKGVSLNKTSITLDKGGGFQLAATVNPSNATNTSVTWSSSDTRVATVTSSGYVRANHTGTATITVMTNSGGKTATCKVTVIRPVTGVSLNKASKAIDKGSGYQLRATVSPSNASNKAVTWSSSNTRVATVSSSGYVTANHAGTTVITVKTNDKGKTATCTIVVTRPVTGVSLNRTSKTIDKGGGYQLTATVSPSNASNKAVTWSSSNTRVATVSANGYVKANHAGTAVITVKTNNGGKTASCTINVVRPVTGVSLNKTSRTIDKGSGYQLKATVAPSNASNKAVTWSSSNTRVATVSPTGYVTANHAGTAVITVKTNDKGKTATCTVTVTRPVTGVTLSKTSKTLSKGKGFQLTASVSPSNASNKAVTWTSSNTRVATVTSDGYIWANHTGTAIITVKTNNGGKTATCTVTVKK